MKLSFRLLLHNKFVIYYDKIRITVSMYSTLNQCGQFIQNIGLTESFNFTPNCWSRFLVLLFWIEFQKNHIHLFHMNAHKMDRNSLLLHNYLQCFCGNSIFKQIESFFSNKLNRYSLIKFELSIRPISNHQFKKIEAFFKYI